MKGSTEAKVKFLTEHDKKKFKYCIITLCSEEIPDTNISEVLAHNCFYISGKEKTYIKPGLHIVVMVVSTVANMFLTLFQAV